MLSIIWRKRLLEQDTPLMMHILHNRILTYTNMSNSQLQSRVILILILIITVNAVTPHLRQMLISPLFFKSLIWHPRVRRILMAKHSKYRYLVRN